MIGNICAVVHYCPCTAVPYIYARLPNLRTAGGDDLRLITDVDSIRANETYTQPGIEPGARYRAGEVPTMRKLLLPVLVSLVLGLDWVGNEARQFKLFQLHMARPCPAAPCLVDVSLVC